jgi:hypothetical protein
MRSRAWSPVKAPGPWTAGAGVWTAGAGRGTAGAGRGPPIIIILPLPSSTIAISNFPGIAFPSPSYRILTRGGTSRPAREQHVETQRRAGTLARLDGGGAVRRHGGLPARRGRKLELLESENRARITVSGRASSRAPRSAARCGVSSSSSVMVEFFRPLFGEPVALLRKRAGD